MVILFRLTNAATNLLDLVDVTFCDLFDKGVMVYLDDIVVYANTHTAHAQLLVEAVKRMHENRLDAMQDKCVFFAHESAISARCAQSMVPIDPERIHVALDLN